MNKNNQQNEDAGWQLLVSLLREIAHEKGITQETIAERTGLLQSNISRLFALKFPPSLKVFVKVANALEVNFFFEDRESKVYYNGKCKFS